MRRMLCWTTTLTLLAAPAHAQSGRAIFEGKGNCHVCHGREGKGTPLAPDLTDDIWIHTDGSLPSLRAVIARGIDKPRDHPAPMPPMGGAKLSAKELDAVVAYVADLAKKTVPDSTAMASRSR
jgi:mono/diheme cytochrome c family protein